MLVLIRNGEVYGPEPQGKKDVLLCAGKIALVADRDGIDPRGAEALGLEIDVIDARGCVVTPGFIDPHTHLTGGSEARARPGRRRAGPAPGIVGSRPRDRERVPPDPRRRAAGA